MKKVVSLLLVLAIVLSLMAGMNVSSFAAFSPRLSSPAKSGWYAGYSRNNCVAYARCRGNEILGRTVSWASGNGGQGFWNTSGFEHGATPKLGAIACWSGHCAVVESINGSNIVLSEGHYSFQPSSSSSSYRNVVINGGGGTAGTWFDNYYGTILSSGKPSECTSQTWYGYVYLTNDTTEGGNTGYQTTRKSATNNIAFYSWKSYSGAKYYNLRAKKIEGSSEVEGDESVWCCADTSATLELREGKYRVYAEAVTNNGVYKYSDDYLTVTFKNPILSATVDGSSTTFSWTAYSGAHHYRLRIYKNKIWTTHVATYDNITSLNYKTTLEPGDYAALIEVFDSNNKNIYYGTAIKFQVEYITKRTSKNNNIVFYSWPSHPRAESYNLRVKRVEGVEWIDDGYSLWGVQKTDSYLVLPEGTYVVYVDALTPEGACQYSIDTVEIKCGNPKLSSSVSGNNVNFNWTAYSGASSYSLRIYKNRIWTDFVDSVEKTTSLSKSLTLPKGDYAAFVEAYNSDGKSLQYSNAISFSVTTELPSACTHSYTSVVTTAATCTSAGVKTYTCSKCGDNYTQAIPAKGHSFVSDKQYCQNGCGTVNPNYVAPHTHTWNSGVVTKAATCTTSGEKTYTCTDCNETKTETIPVLGHALETVILSAATCEVEGLEKELCTRCEYYKTKKIPAFGHDYQEIVTEPTVTTLGYSKYICARCSDTYIDSYTAPTGKLTLKCKARTAAAEAVQWNNVSTATGYQVQISNAAGNAWSTYATLKAGTTAYTFKNLAAGNAYKFRVRFYITAPDGKNYFSPWSSTLTSPTLPSGTTLTKLTTAKKAFTAQWKKNASVNGYQIQYSFKSNFSGAKTITVKSPKTLKIVAKKLYAGKYYYVRIRTYKTISKVNYFSAWSKTYKVKTK